MKLSLWVWPAFALALWVPVWVRWSEWWVSRPEHAHGQLVPVFAAWLVFARWCDAPVPARPERRERAAAVSVAMGCLGLWAVGLVLLTPNPRWPAAQWLGGLGAAGALLAVLWREGGRGQVRHFAGAIFFPLCAAAWPAMIERPVLDFLGPLIADGAAEVVNAAGRLAVAQGNVIEVARGWVGVDEACSGLRSLDAAVLMAWFIGEQRSFVWRGRIRLLLAALATAVAGNFARATALVWIAAEAGPEATEGWHDVLGWAVLAGTLGAVLWIAGWLERDFARPASRAAAAQARPAAGMAGGALLAALSGWAAVALWYRAEDDASARVGWSLAAAPGADWRSEPAPSGLAEVLDATRWEGLAGGADNWRALGYLIAWEGDAAAVEGAFTHGPEICLPGVGYRPTAPLPTITVRSQGRVLELAGERYEDLSGRPQYVWFARWDEHAGRTIGDERAHASPLAVRLAAVRERRRDARFAQIGLVVAGPADAEAARSWAETWAPRLLVRVD